MGNIFSEHMKMAEQIEYGNIPGISLQILYTWYTDVILNLK